MFSLSKEYRIETKRPQTRANETGALIPFLVIILVPIMLLLVLWLNTSQYQKIETSLQDFADDVSVAAAESLCSTRSCWNASLIKALELIDNNSSFHTFVEKAGGSPAGIKTALEALRDELAGHTGNVPLDLRGPNGINKWNFGDVTLEIARGRWWPEGPPEELSVRMDRVVKNFEPFDKLSAEDPDWQAEHPGVPNFLAANAVLVRIERLNTPGIFSFGGKVQELDFESNSVALGARFEQSDVCAAPFAIPACSLLQGGEFDPMLTCDLDRYFTQSDRYCGTDSKGNPLECDVVPGAFWEPLSPVSYCQASNPWLEDPPIPRDKERCNCALSADESWVVGQPPCNQESGVSSAQCHFYPSPLFEALEGGNASDHFGVVGVSESTIDGGIMSVGGATAPGDAAYKQVFSGSGNGCTPSSIGDRFYIKPSGFTDPDTDKLVWNTINGSSYSGDNIAEDRPLHIDVPDLGYQWQVSRVRDSVPWPVPGSAYDDYVRKLSGRSLKSQVQRVAASECQQPDQPAQFGACNSKRVWYDERCQIRDKQWKVPNSYTTSSVPADSTPAVSGTVSSSPVSNTRAILDRDGQPTGQFFQEGPGVVTQTTENFGGSAWSDKRIIPAKIGDATLLNPNYAAGYTSPFELEGWTHEDPRQHIDPKTGKLGQLIYSAEFYDQFTKTMLGFEYEVSSERYTASDPEVVTGNRQAGDFKMSFTCDDIPPYTSCLSSHFDTKEGIHSPENTRVWQTLIPIIADDTTDASSCIGILGSKNSPVTNPNRNWRVIGYVRSYIFDNDIGAAPPLPPGADRGGRALPPFVPGGSEIPTEDIPPVCDYSYDRSPWAFDPDGDGQGDNCNMVRGRVACEARLIASDSETLFADTTRRGRVVY